MASGGRFGRCVPGQKRGAQRHDPDQFALVLGDVLLHRLRPPCGRVGGEPLCEFRSGGAGGGVGDQAVRQDGTERLGHIAEIGLDVLDPVEHGGDRAVPEGIASRGRVTEYGGEAEHIGGGDDASAARHMLRGHEGGAADHAAGGGERGRARIPGDTEVDEPRTVRREHHIAGLHIAVDDPCRVDGRQGPGESGAEHPDLGLVHRTRPADGGGQSRTGHVSGGEPGHFGIGVPVEQQGEMGAGDGPGDGDLPSEAVAEAGVPGHVAADRLDGDRFAASVPGAEEDLSHAARAEPGPYPVGTHPSGRVLPQRTQHAPLPPSARMKRRTLSSRIRPQSCHGHVTDRSAGRHRKRAPGPQLTHLQQ
ncbi:hypothetical protein GA0115254_119928 [Streptomyces sp. Ncost-T10-10d]|nr:hypothetical protein GA0115254_119928 [Streptomyces sp. Ncost-T10-10d]